MFIDSDSRQSDIRGAQTWVAFEAVGNPGASLSNKVVAISKPFNCRERSGFSDLVNLMKLIASVAEMFEDRTYLQEILL